MKRAAAAVLVVFALASAGARADEPNDKQACAEAATLGQVYTRDGKILEAIESLTFCSTSVCPPVVRERCAEWLRSAEAKTGSLTVSVTRSDGTPYPDAKLFVDDKPRAQDERLRLTAGAHAIRVVTEGGLRSSQTTTLREGESQRVVITLAPAPAPAPAPTAPPPPEPPSRALPASFWILGGVGVIGLGGFGFFGVRARQEFDDARACEPTCPHDRVQRIRDQALIADVSLVTGIAALAGAAIVYFTSMASRPSASGARTSLRR